jgi:acyl carrier protein
MGFDTAEFIMSAEREFDILLDGADLQRIRTVGEFHRLVMRELREQHDALSAPRPQPTVCKTSRAFYRLRRAMLECGIADRSRIRPGAALPDLIPARHRRTLWKNLAAALSCELPPLQRPGWVVFLILPVSIVLAAAFILRLGFAESDSLIWIVIPATALLFAAMMAASRPLAVSFPGQTTTLTALAHHLSTTDPEAFLPITDRITIAHGWTNQQAWDRISALVVERTGVDPSEITPDADFIDDLRMD